MAMDLLGTGNGSCFNCRTRKVRCDRTLPQCSQCKHRNLECLAPEAPPRMVWLPPKTVGTPILDYEDFDVDMHVRRQLLFKRGQQACNAADLVSLISKTSIGFLLEQIDHQADGIQNGETKENGPFCVFRCEKSPVLSPVPLLQTPELCGLELWPLVSHPIGDELSHDDIIQLSWSPDIYIPDGHPVQGDEQYENNQEPPEESLPSPPGSGALLVLGPSRMSPADLEDFTMSTTKLLLDHYQNSMVSIYTPVRVDYKSPWEILYVPNVLSTLGEISLTGNSSNAKVALLFAVFAISAFGLDIRPTSNHGPVSQDWRALGNLCRERATRRLQLSLRDLSAGHQKKDKYKNILMPLLSMMTISVVSGEMKNAAHYLRDIDQFITLYGITKARKSRKVKMLHCIYLYLRVLTEGTIIHDRNLDLDGAGEGEPGLIFTQQNPSTWDILLRESSHPHEVLNLDFMQSITAPKSTFEQIYSIPESLFRLILETTQLAREVEGLHFHQRPKNVDYDTFSLKVKKLESRICDWEYQYHERISSHDSITSHDLTNTLREKNFPSHLIQAIYSALMIYFYRSVRDVNAVALQPYVQQTIYHLIEHDKQKEKYKDHSSDICWPGFIAGCEATKPQSREQISGWLERSARSSGIRMFEVALQAVQKVWAARSLPGKQNLSWGRVLREFSDLRVLVLS